MEVKTPVQNIQAPQLQNKAQNLKREREDITDVSLPNLIGFTYNPDKI
jgi:hypothetical protein